MLDSVSLVIHRLRHKLEGEAGVGVHVEHVILEVVEAVCRREANLRGRRGRPEQGSRLLCRSRVWGLQVVAHLCKDLVVLSVDLCDFPVGPRSDPLQRCNKQGEHVGEVRPAHAPDEYDGGVGRVELTADKCWNVACLGGRCYAPSRDGGQTAEQGGGR